ncbi:MAG: hypothetical protein ACRDTF_15775 [Pseudonocardiaceae bacterium]
MRTTRNFIALGLIMVSMLGLAGFALAEGSFTSSITHALTGFESRRWTDRDADNVSTSVQFDRCRNVNRGFTSATADVRLWRDISFSPDEDRGSRFFDCGISSTQYYGDQPAGDFYFELTRIDGFTSGGRLDVDFVRVGY